MAKCCLSSNLSCSVHFLILQFENLVDGLIEGAAGSFDFDTDSFLPARARMSLEGFVNASVGSIDIAGTYVTPDAYIHVANSCE